MADKKLYRVPYEATASGWIYVEAESAGDAKELAEEFVGDLGTEGGWGISEPAAETTDFEIGEWEQSGDPTIESEGDSDGN